VFLIHIIVRTAFAQTK